MSKTKRRTVKGAILEIADKGEVFTTETIREEVRKFYQSRTGWEQMFMTQRISEACGRLVTSGHITRVGKGMFKKD
jgi:hypothetical protein